MFTKLHFFYNLKLDELERIFIHERFTILETNLVNVFQRKIFEGLHITLHKPDLNKQVNQTNTNLICSCQVKKKVLAIT